MEPGSVDSIIPADPGQLLDQLIAYPDPGAFAPAVKRLARLYRDYLRFASPPFISERLQLTAEVRLQSELYLPLAEIAAVFRRLYCATLTYPPLFASTPFHNPLSWADLFVSLPDCYQTSPDPSRLLQRLLDDRQQLIGFMLHSFFPLRFYGRRWRYPGQLEQIRAWLASNGRRSGLRLLDAACGTGEGGQHLVGLLLQSGRSLDDNLVAGWTLEPLEVWVADARKTPLAERAATAVPAAAAWLDGWQYHDGIVFSCCDLLAEVGFDGLEPYDLIVCNGLLGGPIDNAAAELERVADNLVDLLAPGGTLFVADSFHGGWRKALPLADLQALFQRRGLSLSVAGEGFATSRVS